MSENLLTVDELLKKLKRVSDAGKGDYGIYICAEYYLIGEIIINDEDKLIEIEGEY